MSTEITKGREEAFVSSETTTHESYLWVPTAWVDKFDDDQTAWAMLKLDQERITAADFEALGIKPYETLDAGKNLLTTAGLTRLTSLLNGAGGQAATNTATRIGVGNGAGTAAVGDTALSAAAGSANQWWQIMDATFPSTSAGVVTFKSTFGTADGNFAWNEWAIDIGTPTVTSGATVNATMLNHKTSAALGTKASGSTWAFTVTITFA